MSKTPRRKISSQRSRRPSRPVPTIQPRYRRTTSTASQPTDLQVLGIAAIILGTVTLFILSSYYTWAFDLLGFIILVLFIAYLLTGIMNK